MRYGSLYAIAIVPTLLTDDDGETEVDLAWNCGPNDPGEDLGTLTMSQAKFLLRDLATVVAEAES